MEQNELHHLEDKKNIFSAYLLEVGISLSAGIALDSDKDAE